MYSRSTSRVYSRIILCLSIIFIPNLALAQSESPVGEGLGYIINTFINGEDGIILATLAIACVGVLCFTHHLEWKRLFQTVGGIAVVFGASSIAEGIKALVH